MISESFWVGKYYVCILLICFSSFLWMGKYLHFWVYSKQDDLLYLWNSKKNWKWVREVSYSSTIFNFFSLRNNVLLCFMTDCKASPLFIKLLKIIYFYISYSINGKNMNTIFIFLFVLLSCKKTFITIFWRFFCFRNFFVFVIVLFCFDKICREILIYYKIIRY